MRFLKLVFEIFIFTISILTTSISVLIFCAGVIFLSQNNSEREQITQTGHYKNGKRVGAWEFETQYILDNGNDGHIIEKGHYNERGLKDGVWTKRTPYTQISYIYKDGVVIEIMEIIRELVDFPDGKLEYAVMKTSYDEEGQMLEKKRVNKEDCERFFEYLHSTYYNECHLIVKGIMPLD